MTTRRFGLGWGAGAVGLLLVLPLAAYADVNLGAHLEPTDADPHASGFVQYSSQHDNRSIAVAVRHVTYSNLVMVLVNDEFLGFIHLDHTGSGHLSLSTFHHDEVPELSHGDVVDVVDASDGTLLLEGVLAGL